MRGLSKQDYNYYKRERESEREREREREMEVAEHKEIVIVGGGICGLATALALHRLYISF